MRIAISTSALSIKSTPFKNEIHAALSLYLPNRNVSYTTSEDNDDVLLTLKHGEESQNSNKRNPYKIELINTQLKQSVLGTWFIMNKVCMDLQKGGMMIMCGDESRTHEGYLSIAENMEIPLVNWDLAPVLPNDGPVNKFM
ncbi:unnamed protein product [Dracunculus medinensis]|uniref:PFK domain-containing protein n=1 Tax=Dracunculus medinensis TaxID=318479 RepID=A0A0N4U7M8_DRAME|nr:unnamed protein product [Dracunculus medinensis]